MHYYQHHIGDFIKATSRLSDSQAMAYLRLIWIYYDRNGVVENDPKQLAFEIGSDEHTVSLIIKTYFEVDGNNLRQSRCDKELQGYLAKSTGGKVGAEKRWKNKVSDRLPIANPMPPQCDPNANQEPITKNHIYTPEGVNPSIFADFKKLRDKQKAPITETAIKGLKREADKAKMTLDQVMQLCCERGWRGFKADWVQNTVPNSVQNKPAPLATNQQIEDAYRKECGGDPTKARFKDYFEMRRFVEDFRDKQKRAAQETMRG